MIIYKFIKHLIEHFKYIRALKKICREESLLNNLSKLFGVEFRMDWVGRIYTVMNPNISHNQYDGSTQIYEYNENGLDNTAYVERWIMERLNIASQFINSNDLFDILTYTIKKLDDYDNYLFVMKPITFDDCKTWTKRFLILMGILITISTILLIIF